MKLLFPLVTLLAIVFSSLALDDETTLHQSCDACRSLMELYFSKWAGLAMTTMTGADGGAADEMQIDPDSNMPTAMVHPHKLQRAMESMCDDWKTFLNYAPFVREDCYRFISEHNHEIATEFLGKPIHPHILPPRVHQLCQNSLHLCPKKDLVFADHQTECGQCVDLVYDLQYRLRRMARSESSKGEEHLHDLVLDDLCNMELRMRFVDYDRMQEMCEDLLDNDSWAKQISIMLGAKEQHPEMPIVICAEITQICDSRDEAIEQMGERFDPDW